MVTTTPQEEERAAREQYRQLEKARKAAARQREKDGTKLANIIRDELSRPRARRCRCGITPRMTRVQLDALGAGCTAGRWVCSTLDAIRRRDDR